MEFLENLLSVPLGYLMYFCYKILTDYGWAIVLFTLLTKVVLLPLSVWLQKNSVKIVKITPEINRIKATYFGDGDAIAEKTSQLYKREKYNPFASIIPLFIQLVLLMGLVQVIYNPLTHLFRLDTQVSMALVEHASTLADIDVESSSVQMEVVDMIQNPEYTQSFYGIQEQFPDMDWNSVMNTIQDANMSFFGISLGQIPMSAGGMTLLMPVAAAIAAWLLCIAQNKLNPLQAEQGNVNKIGMTIFSVALSLFLGAFVPLGVGYYWVWSNLFSIIQQIFLNMIINPKKYIDYQELEKSKEELAGLMSLGGKKRLFNKNPYAKKEKEDYKRFFSIVNKHFVIYSEGSGYYKYFKDIMNYVIEHSNIKIHYITNDPEDQIFELAKEQFQIKPYYIGEKKLITLMMKMDADIVLMTTPDLENYYLKRSYLRKDIEYIYVNHGVGSDNLLLRTHALDNFDTIFCVGPHIIEEQRALEKLYGFPEKKLVETGYCLFDNMTAAYEAEKDKLEKEADKEKKTVLIAPSWQKDNILDLCLDDLLEGIVGQGYKVIVRPHPQYVRIYQAKMQQILSKYADRMDENFIIETDFSSNSTVYSADLIITDWSNIAYEFSFTTHKPALYINTPMKVMNPEWEKIDVVPFEIRIRDAIGTSLDVDKLHKTKETIDRLIAETSKYHDIISEIIQDTFYHIGRSAEVSGQYILDSLQAKQREKKKSS